MRSRFYDSEKYTKPDGPQAELNNLSVRYYDLKEKTDNLTRQATDLKESHQSGAIDSIKKASRLSDDASRSLESTNLKVESELKPAIELLEFKISMSKENFDKSDKLLKEYLNGVLQNLTDSMQGIHGLNEAVCGELTSESQQCSAKCGGAAVCNGKCGTNSSSCSGLVDSYWNLVNTKNTYDELYKKHELNFKQILTKLRGTSNLLHNANKDLNEILNYANNTLNQIESKKKELTDLSVLVQNFTDSNRDRPTTIKNVSQKLLKKIFFKGLI